MSADEVPVRVDERADAFDNDDGEDGDDGGANESDFALPSAPVRAISSATPSLAADAPTVQLLRTSSSSAIAMDLGALLRSAEQRDAHIYAVLELKDIPRARLQRCTRFVHILDSGVESRAAAAARAIADEEAAAGATGTTGAEMHAQLVHALQLARTECTQLREDRRQRLIDANRTRGELRALQARVAELEASLASNRTETPAAGDAAASASAAVDAAADACKKSE